MNANEFLKGRSGIYAIRNTINNKIYVGKTKCMYRRCKQYLYDVNHRHIGHVNDHLYNSIVKYGLSNFEFFPLEFALIDDLARLELEWMIKLNSIDRSFGYNLRLDTSTGMIVHPETSEKISNNLKLQWKDGVRDGHAEKLRKLWANDPERRMKQSRAFSKYKTKYSYIIQFPDGVEEKCDYARLKELKLQNVIVNFYRKKSDEVTHKGFKIKRFKII